MMSKFSLLSLAFFNNFKSTHTLRLNSLRLVSSQKVEKQIKFNSNRPISYDSRPLFVPQSSKRILQLFSTRYTGYHEEISQVGELYEMVELPDRMLDTTIFIGNLCEFVDDDMLSNLFQEVSSLRFVPASVARKPNGSSLKYAFCTFPTKEEKRVAIEKFNGYSINDKQIKVEPINDDPKRGRVRVPGKLVTYVLGDIKRTQNGKVNTLRRISKDDVERLSRGQNSKIRGYGSRNVPHRLNEEERGAFKRAMQYGFVSLDGTGYRRGRKGSPLSNIHRQWCDAKAKPQIILLKASGGRQLDNIVVDLSPLRIGALTDDNAVLQEFLLKWKIEILTAAERAGMVLNPSIEEDNTIQYEMDDDDDAMVETPFVNVFTIAPSDWAHEPIWRLPIVSSGVFEGERPKAKAMAKELAKLWNCLDPHVTVDHVAVKSRKNAGARRGGKTKMKTLSRFRR